MLSPDPADPRTDPPAVALDDVAVALEGRPVLRGIDLRVGSGEFVALLGANGSGKSTLVRTVVGLLPTTRGRVELFGEPVERFHDWRRVGFVPQRAGAGSGVPASVHEVVTSGRLGHRRIMRRLGAEDRAAVDEALETVGLSHRAEEPVSSLSGGQQQRVLIARALAARPDLLVLDEPTAGVDAENQEALARTLERLSDRGVTVLLVAHELGPLTPLIDRAVVLGDGRVRREGAAADLAGETHHGHHAPRTPVDHLPHVAHPFGSAADHPLDLARSGHEEHP
ncbi:ABC transporter ATP-binding protein [Nocardioidaceae bacterium]|nr:ABC transporter ATP-binding protein [Nocardioidaceae bacterium]